VDKVRFGRALGYGTRHAAKTIAAAVDAASTPDPRPRVAGAPGPARQAVTGQVVTAPASPGRTRQAKAGVQHLGRSLWTPLAHFSSVLWLRVTGLFFALIAWAMGTGAWRLRGAAQGRPVTTDTQHFWLFAGFGVLFGYFAVSSFVRASLRERRAAGR
jgi:hypothetical protein